MPRFNHATTFAFEWHTDRPEIGPLDGKELINAARAWLQEIEESSACGADAFEIFDTVDKEDE